GARSYAHGARVRFEHVAGTGEYERHLGVGDDHHGLKPAKVAVCTPVLGEFDRRPGELARILLEFGFKALEQGKRVRGRAREPADDVALAKPPDLPGIGLDDGLSDGDLAVAPDRDR